MPPSESKSAPAVSAAEEPSHEWFTRDGLLTVLLGLVTLAAFYLCFRLVQPFVASIAFALAIAVAADKPYLWLRKKLKRNTASATIAVIAVLLIIVGPITLLATYVVQQGIQQVGDLRAAGMTWENALEQYPSLKSLWNWGEQNLHLSGQIDGLKKGATEQAGGILKGSVTILTNLVILMFVLFFLFRDRDGGLRAVRRLLPLSDREASRMFSRIANTIRATVNGSLLVGLVQAIMAGIMYVALGVPAAVIWAAITFLAALVPMFGTALVWAPIALYLALTGSMIKAAILVGWAALAVGTIDNLLYPYLVGDQMRVHTVPTFFSILGGISVFGGAGLILGPLTLAITLGLLDVWWWRTADGKDARHPEISKAKKTVPSAVLGEDEAR